MAETYDYPIKGDISKQPFIGRVVGLHEAGRFFNCPWGFIQDEANMVHYVHFLQTACPNFAALQVGDKVAYELKDPPDRNGPHAKSVRFLRRPHPAERGDDDF